MHNNPAFFPVVKKLLILAAVSGLSVIGRADTVSNGDFSGGNTRFSSDYTNVSSSSCPFGAGDYMVGTNPNACNSGWVNIGASPGNGSSNMMIVNNSETANQRVWYESLTTTPGTSYTFTFWLGDIDNSSYNSSPATLDVWLNGSLISGCSGYTESTSGGWAQEKCTYTSTSSPETLALVDTNLVVNGGDFALDNISDPAASTSPVPEPSSLLVCLAAAAILNRARSKRRV